MSVILNLTPPPYEVTSEALAPLAAFGSDALADLQTSTDEYAVERAAIRVRELFPDGRIRAGHVAINLSNVETRAGFRAAAERFALNAGRGDFPADFFRAIAGLELLHPADGSHPHQGFTTW